MGRVAAMSRSIAESLGRILLVEDEAIVADDLAETLAGMGYTIAATFFFVV